LPKNDHKIFTSLLIALDHFIDILKVLFHRQKLLLFMAYFLLPEIPGK